MGLFDFIADVGQKLFTSDAEAAEKIKQHIEANNPGIENLEVGYQDESAFLKGKANSYEAVEKAILMAGNIKGVANVVNEIQVEEAAPAEANVEYYVIQKGDSLSLIAKRYYGDPMAYTKIFEANREVIQDPDKIFPGQKIRIPLS
ncbi:MAG: peptidoglycan-binding protein LysM [Methylothermaceae bacteria B42]|nr:MAG: peptidoglycan-binding protein LysM [Methylothermaceae bacteria B42]HHJ39225.1 peptidoglycan-binding protein LysM [Methylothermaceae bacterium]